MADNPIGTENDEFKEIRERVTELVLAEGWKIQRADSPDAAWVFMAEDPSGKMVAFGQNPKFKDHIDLQSNISIDPAHRQQFEALPQEEMEEFLWDLRFRLLSSGVRFAGLQQPFERVALRCRIYRDELESMGGLHRTLEKMSDAMLLVVWMISKKLGQGAPSDQRMGFAVN